MTHQDAQATFDVVASTIWIHTLFSRVLIGPNSTHYFILVSFIGLLGMLIASLDFDLIVGTPLWHSIVDNIMFRGCLVMIGYMEMLVDLVLIDL